MRCGSYSKVWSGRRVRISNCCLSRTGRRARCDEVAGEYSDRLTIRYFYKENSGRSLTRNYGMERAEGRYLVFFDSDCIIPPSYFETVRRHLDETYVDCYGGPDAAHRSFSRLQKPSIML